MDYRKPAVFGENWSPSRYRVLPYFAVEKKVMTRPDVRRILDLGCASGWNMSRFRQYGRPAVGIDIVPDRVRLAAAHGPVSLASGLDLPFVAGSFDVIYIQHVLHHIGDVRRALAQVHRCLRPEGVLFLVETIEDSPLIHWGRRVFPSWRGDDITARFQFDQLRVDLQAEGFDVEEGRRYSVLFWVWEILPDRWPWFEKLTPAAVAIEALLVRLFRPWAAHCYLVARKNHA